VAVQTVRVMTPDDESAAISRARELVTANRKLSQDEATLDLGAAAAAAEEQARLFFREVLPFHRLIGVAD